MARKTAAEEVEKLTKQFFAETKEGLWLDIRQTRQMSRRKALLAEVDALDKVEGRFYHWLTSLGGDK
jgi:hypothetical protein